MPDEPKSPEELLAAYAEQRRREQGDPATLAAFRRKQLQDEVARTYGTGATGTTAAKVGWWTWPRLAWLGVACAVTVVGVLSFNPAKEQELALQRSANAPVASSELQDNLAAANSLSFKEAAPPAPGEPVDALSITPRPLDRTDKAKADGFGRAEIAATPTDNAIAPAAPAPASSRSVETLSRDQSRSPAGDAVKLSDQPFTPQLGVALETRQQNAVEETKRLAKTEAGREIAETKSLADASDVMLKQAETKDTTNARLFYAEDVTVLANQSAASQRYVQVDNRAQYRRNFNSPPPLPVMNQFSVQQNGPQVVIVDADGSQYTGLITNAPALAQTLTGQAAAPSAEMVQRYGLALPAVQTAAAGGVSGAEANNVWFFRVSGTNRSLNQSVVFEGNLLNSVPAELEAMKAQNTQAGVGEATTSLATATAAPAQSVNSNTYNFQNSPGISNSYQNFYQNAYQNSQIRGRVTVGGSNQVEINALSAQP